MRLLSVPAQAKGVPVRAIIDPRLPAHIMGDMARIRQILVNLGGNAVKFTERGDISIRCERARSPRSGPDAALSPSAIRASASRPSAARCCSTRSRRSTRRRRAATAARASGLSIVKRLAELMGGDGRRREHPGHGLDLLVHARHRCDRRWCVPRLLGRRGRSCREGGRRGVRCDVGAAPFANRRPRILLAEDNLVNQKVATRVLEKEASRSTSPVDGRQAVDAWRRGTYDLILMDCQMPQLDGYEATREIRREERENRRCEPHPDHRADGARDERRRR